MVTVAASESHNAAMKHAAPQRITTKRATWGLYARHVRPPSAASNHAAWGLHARTCDPKRAAQASERASFKAL